MLADKLEAIEFFFFAGIDEARFKRQVIPGDQLVFEVELLTNKRGIGKFSAVAKVDGQVAVEAIIMCAKREQRVQFLWAGRN